MRAHESPETRSSATVGTTLAAGRRRGWPGNRHRPHLPGRRSGRGWRLPPRRSERPGRRPPERPRADAAGDGRGASSPHPRRQAHAREHHLRDGRGARRSPYGLPHRLRCEQRRAVPRVRHLPRDHRKDARRGPARPTRQPSRTTVPHWKAASSKSCRRWASPCWPATGARRFSSASAWRPGWWRNALRAPATQIEGIGFREIAEESLRRHALAYGMPGNDGRAQTGGQAYQPRRTTASVRQRRGARGDAADDQEFPHLRADQRAGGLQEIPRYDAQRDAHRPARPA